MSPPPSYTGPADNRTRYEVPDRTRHMRGGLGVVFRALLTETHAGLPAGTAVGLKLHSGIDEERFLKLANRSSRLAELDHPSLARHIECFVGPAPTPDAVEEEDCDQFLSAHVWVEGKSLAKAMTDGPPAVTLGWLRHIADGLDYLHAAGLAHRDVTPRNIVLADDGPAVLIDYDTILWGDLGDTSLYNISGFSPAPRVGLVGAQSVDRSMLAATALVALAGRPAGLPDEQATRSQLLQRLVGIAADPHYVLAVIDRLRSAPPLTASSVIDEIHTALSNRRRQAPSPRPGGPRPKPRRHRQLFPATLLLVGGIVLTGTMLTMVDLRGVTAPDVAPTRVPTVKATSIPTAPSDPTLVVDTCNTFGNCDYWDPILVHRDSRISGQLGTLARGSTVEAVCWTYGRTFTDGSNATSSDDGTQFSSALWYGIDFKGRRGYVSAVWTTKREDQLELPACE